MLVVSPGATDKPEYIHLVNTLILESSGGIKDN